MRLLSAVLLVSMLMPAATEAIGLEREQDQQSPAVKALLGTALQHGSVRVIVGLRVTGNPDPQTIRRLQSAVLRRVLRTSKPQPTTVRFDAIPYLSLSVDPKQLRRLIDDPDVVSIQEDVPVPPSSSSSNHLE